MSPTSYRTAPPREPIMPGTRRPDNWQSGQRRDDHVRSEHGPDKTPTRLTATARLRQCAARRARRPRLNRAEPAAAARHTLRRLPAVARVLVPLPRIRVMRRRAVVLREQIQAEVAVEVPPHGMDVVGVVLRVVVLDEERRALD